MGSTCWRSAWAEWGDASPVAHRIPHVGAARLLLANAIPSLPELRAHALCGGERGTSSGAMLDLACAGEGQRNHSALHKGQGGRDGRKNRRRTRRRQLTDCQAQHCGAKRQPPSFLRSVRVADAAGKALEEWAQVNKRLDAAKAPRAPRFALVRAND
jgi:hypothetical protein